MLSQEEPEWVAMADNFTRLEEVLQPRLNAFSLLALIERMKSSEAVDRAIKGHLKHHRARKFVEAEWGKHKHAYKGNKSAFSRVYARRVKNELGVDITEKQMREVWLVDTLFADKPDGLP